MTRSNSELDKPDLKLVRALQKDFEKLYVKEFTTAWKWKYEDVTKPELRVWKSLKSRIKHAREVLKG